MKWLVVDSNYMCHRAFHSTGGLRHRENITGVPFGVLRDVVMIQNELMADGIVWCFDSRQSDRKKIYPSYKANRKVGKHLSDQEQLAKKQLHSEILKMRKEYLPQIGFRNVFMQVGKEADDLIASVVRNLACGDSAVILSNDEDMFQLLGGGVSMMNPTGRVYTNRKSFIRKWQLQPEMWANVKAIAGCSSDNVKGVYGVGEIKAARWIRGEVEPGSPLDEKIRAALKVVNANMKLVKLPIEGTDNFDLVRDRVTRKSWRSFLNKMGFASLSRLEPRSIWRNRDGKKRVTRKK